MHGFVRKARPIHERVFLFLQIGYFRSLMWRQLFGTQKDRHTHSGTSISKEHAYNYLLMFVICEQIANWLIFPAIILNWFRIIIMVSCHLLSSYNWKHNIVRLQIDMLPNCFFDSKRNYTWNNMTAGLGNIFESKRLAQLKINLKRLRLKAINPLKVC